MRILIAGAGTIGSNLAQALTGEGQEVVVVDPQEERLEGLANSVDCQLVHGSALSPELLENAGIRHTDLVVAVTESDAVNVTVCRLADYYRVPEKMARVRDPELADPDCPVPPEHFGIDHLISPERLTVDHIEQLLSCPGAREAVDFERGRILLRAFLVGEESALAGERVMTIKRQLLPGDYLLAAIRRAGAVRVPKGDSQLRLGDTVYVIAGPEELPRLVKAFNPEARPVRSALVYGAGTAGVALCRRLAERLRRVVLVEPDARRAQRAADELDPLGVEVMHGTALDEDLLTRLGADRIERFVGISDDDEENTMGALLFRKYGGGEPVVVTSRSHYLDILESVDLDLTINPRALAVSALLRHIRGSTVLSVAKLRREDAEVVEFRVAAGSRLTTRPLKDQRLPGGVLVAAVLRGNALAIPGGEYQIAAGDRVLLFSDGRHGQDLGRLVR